MSRIGVLGAGAFTRYTLEAYRDCIPGIQLAAIASRTRSKAEVVAKDFAIDEVKGSNDELLEDPDIDLVVILTPPQTHYELAMAALRQGKHLLIDKPISFTSEQANDIVALAREKKVELSTNLVLRVNPFHQRIRKIRKNGSMGKLLQIVSTGLLARYPEDHWYWDEETSGGFFLNTFSHFLDLFDFISGEEPSFMRSFGDPRNGYTLISSYPSGLHATLGVSLQVSNPNELVRTSYIFERGTIEIRGWVPERVNIRPDEGESQVHLISDRDEEYQRALGLIMKDLLQRIEEPELPSTTGITMDVMLHSVTIPLAFERNTI